MILKPKPVSIRQFNYDRATRTLAAEISSTNGMGRVFDDAADEGLTIVSSKGVEVVFCVDRTNVKDGEIIGWTLRPVGDWTGSRLTVELFND